MNYAAGLMGFAIMGCMPLLVAMPSRAQVAQITDISVNALEDGLQVLLVTSDPTSPEVFQFQEQNTLFIDIVGAQLALPVGDAYQRSNPAPSVTSILAEQVSEQEVQIAIEGAVEADINATLERTVGSLVLDIVIIATADDSTTSLDSEFGDTLRIIVAAEPLPRYLTPTVSAGTRTDTDILDIPQGIQVIPQEVIEDQGTASLGDTLRNVSGVFAGRAAASGRATTPVIRGFETDNILRNGLRDDTLRISSGINNIERIEILKGPASVLFGSGNLGGTINLVTEVPLSQPRYEVEFTAGSNNALYRPAIDLTGPLDESGETAYRLNLAYENQDSFKDLENGEFFFIAPSLQVINTERNSLIIDFEYLNIQTRGTAPLLPAISAIGVEDNTLVDTIVSGGGEAPPPELAGTLDLRANLGEPDISRSETSISRIGYRFQHDFSDSWTFRNEFLGSFQNSSSDSIVGISFVQERGQPNFSLLNRVFLENPSNQEIYTLNTNVVGNFEIIGIEQTLLLGVEWSREEEEDKITQRLFLPFLSPESEQFNIFEPNYDSRRFFPKTSTTSGANIRPGSNTFTREQTLGLYGQTQLNLSDYLIIVLGGRVDFADQFFQDLDNRADVSPIETSESVFSPRAGLVVKPTENVSLYASYTESFNPTIGRGEDGEVFTSELGKQFEVGVKATLLGDRLSATLAYYDLRRSNVLTQDPTNPGFQVQVGEQASNGVELDIVGEILPGWNIIANYAYTNARITEDNEFPEGRRLINVPEHAAGLWTSYEIQDGDLAGFGFGLGVYFQGERNGDIRTPFILPSYTRTDASVFYRKGQFRTQLNFQNLFNVRYFEGARDQFRVNPGTPFTVLGSVAWEF